MPQVKHRRKSPLKPVRENRHRMRFEQWFDQSGYDVAGAKHSFAGLFYEWTCYQCAQAVEKSLKSVILHAGWYPPRTHKLSVLIGLCNNVNPLFRQVKFKFRDIEVFTFTSRYPFVIPGEMRSPHDYVTKQQAEICLREAVDIINKIKDVIHQQVSLGNYEDVEEIESLNIEDRIAFVKNSIVDNLDPELIVLFGSYGRGELRLSTMDVLVVGKSEDQYVDRVNQIREITKGGLPVVQPVFLTPEEFLDYKDSDAMIRNALYEGRVIYRSARE